ncbi:MAG: hypothetical protein A3I66_13815 [Burkholderiales bacterium RIFCSPLOWO2_02_FULL_57_36]|nr:MAG: hypothetical protein A3I66_13815 [Burkholderiales bacterium RIFCSPLOWO2_02_FULL_57_36]
MAICGAFLLAGHAHAAVPCAISIDPIWQEADGLRGKLENDPFAAAFGTFVSDIKNNDGEFQQWRVDAEHYRDKVCTPYRKSVEAHGNRIKIFVSKGCSQPKISDPGLYAWCLEEHAWLISEAQKLEARETSEVNPKFDRLNQRGQVLLAKERQAVTRAKEMLDPYNLENTFRLYAFAVRKNVLAGVLTSCEALAQMSDALGPRTGWQYGRHLAVMGTVLAPTSNPLVYGAHPRSVVFTAGGFRRRYVGPPGSERDNQVRHAVGYLMMGAEFGATGAAWGTYWEDRFKKRWHGQVPEEHDYLLGVAAGEIGRDLKTHVLSVEELGRRIRAVLCGT